MNFAVLGEHRDFFRKHQWIECEQLIPPTRLERLVAGVEQALSSRLKQPISLKNGEALLHHSADLLFRHGRDLWRENKEVKKILFSKNLAEVAAELIEAKPLRFGYDQLLLPPLSAWQVENALQAIQMKAQNSPAVPFDQMSCIQGVACGAIVCIQAPLHLSPALGASFFPKTPGNVLIFKPTFAVPFQQLWTLPGFLYLMLVYAKPNAVYYLQQNDPHAHAFKDWGYNFGDALKDTLNPIIYP